MDYNDALKNAINYYLSENIAEASSLFESLIINYPSKFESYYYLGKIEANYYNNVKKAIELMLKSVEICPFYEGYRELTEYSIIENNVHDILKYAKQTLTYNSKCEQTLMFLKKLFPKEAHFIKDKETVINGEYQYSGDCPQLKYHKSYDAGIIERKAPSYIEEFLTDNQKTLLNQAIANNNINNFKEGFVLKIPDGRAFIKQSDQTYIISPDNKILNDMLVENCPDISVETLPNELRIADKMLVLSSCWGGNFYHWLTWTVPRICMIEKAGYDLNDFDKIVINYAGFKFQYELLELLGIPRRKIIGSIPDGAVLRAKTLITASLPSHMHTPQIVTDSLREKLLNPEYIDELMPKRIYISRNKSNSRFILNEDEVYLHLQKFGFVVVCSEDYNVAEQVKIFANADVIISQHGAGLVNLSFCKPKTKVIEIFNEFMKDNLDAGYFRICDNVQLDHYIMFGEPMGRGAFSNMNIDINKLSKTMELANITVDEHSQAML